MKNASETIPGNYYVATLPGGQLVAFTRLKNGEWVQTKDRVEEEKKTETLEFEKRFEGTATVPNNFVQRDTETLVPDADKMKASIQGTINRIDAYLGEILGNPEDILSGKIQVNKVQIVRHKEQAIGLIEALNCPKWNKVKNLLWN